MLHAIVCQIDLCERRQSCGQANVSTLWRDAITRGGPTPGCCAPGPRFAARSGVPRGRSPLGCVLEGGSEKALRDGDELGKRPTYSRSTERNSRAFAYYSREVMPVCINYAFHYSYWPRYRCARKSGKLICGRVGNPSDIPTSARSGGLAYAR